jgi:hypothetical protein
VRVRIWWQPAGRGVDGDQIDTAIRSGAGAAHLIEFRDRLEELQDQLLEFVAVKVQKILDGIEAGEGIKFGTGR